MVRSVPQGDVSLSVDAASITEPFQFGRRAAVHSLPDSSKVVQQVHVFYSVDPHPVVRFWRSAEAKREENTWTAKLPILSVQQPLFAFANVHCRLDQSSPSAQQDRPTDTFALSSKIHTVTPDDLQRVGAKATDKPSMLIDDFAHGFQDWYRLSADNPHHWAFSTRKLGDPKWQGKPGYRLTLDVKTNKPNDLIVVITDNFFRSHRGKEKEFVAVVKLTVGDQTVSLSPQEFRQTDGEDTLTSWQNADILSLRAYVEKGEKLIGSKSWAGSQPEFRNLRWTTE